MSGVPFISHDLPITTGDLVTPSGSDVTLTTSARYIRVGGAGALVLRYPGSAADITISAAAGEYVPVSSGVIIRSAGTVATVLHALGV